MAGIGFELRKMFSEDNTVYENVKAISYSTIVSVGPWIFTIATLNIFNMIGKKYIFQIQERQILMATIVYSFIFSQIFSSPWQYLITRYVADCIYKNKQNQLRGIFSGITKLIFIVSFLAGTIFMRNSHFPQYFKYTSILLFSLLSSLWIAMNFVSLLKDYNFIIKMYISGNLISLTLGVLFLKYPILKPFTEYPSYSILLAYTIGILITFTGISMQLMASFEKINSSEFKFVNYLNGYISLVITGIFFVLGTWSHIFINWTTENSFKIGGVFITNPDYEIAIFYGFLIMIPTLVYFMIFMETKFFPFYKKYYFLINNNGNLDETEKEREKMIKTLRSEIFYSMELQFLISISFILLSKSIFTYFKIEYHLLDLFRISVFGAYCSVYVSIFLIILLYFDSRREALIISLVYVFLNTIFSWYFTKLGPEYSGFGFFLGSFIALLLSDILLKQVLENLNYVTFYRQNFINLSRNKKLEFLENLLNKKIYMVLVFISMIFLTGCSSYDNRGFNTKTGRNWHTMGKFDISGYDVNGYTRDGLDNRGFNQEGWHKYTDSPYDYYGFDFAGIHKDTKTKYNERGFNQEKIHKKTNKEYDEFDFDFAGIHKKTKTEYNEKGWSLYGLNKNTKDYFNQNGYTQDGYDKRGFNQNGWNKYTNSSYDYYGFNWKGIHKGTGTKYNERGFNQEKIHKKTNTKFDEFNFDFAGIHKETGEKYDKEGWTWYGLNKNTQSYYNKQGYNKEGYNKNGYDQNGYDRNGINIAGYNLKGEFKEKLVEKNIEEYDAQGYNSEGIDKDGYDKTGRYIGG